MKGDAVLGIVFVAYDHERRSRRTTRPRDHDQADHRPGARPRPAVRLPALRRVDPATRDAFARSRSRPSRSRGAVRPRCRRVGGRRRLVRRRAPGRRPRRDRGGRHRRPRHQRGGGDGPAPQRAQRGRPTTESAVEAVSRLDRFAHDIEGARATTLLYGIVDSRRARCGTRRPGHPPALVVDTTDDPLPRRSTRVAARRRRSQIAAVPKRSRDSPGQHHPLLHGRLGGTAGRAPRGRAGPTRGAPLNVAHFRSNSCATNCSTLLVGDEHPDDVALVGPNGVRARAVVLAAVPRRRR